MWRLVVTLAIVAAAAGQGIEEPDESKRHLFPLLYAAGEGDAKAIRKLLAAGADPNAEKSPYGETPLHTAAIPGHAEVTKLLLDAGAVVDARTLPGAGIAMTPLMCVQPPLYTSPRRFVASHAPLIRSTHWQVGHFSWSRGDGPAPPPSRCRPSRC